MNKILFVILMIFFASSCKNNSSSEQNISFNINKTLIFKSYSNISIPISKRYIYGKNKDFDSLVDMMYFWTPDTSLILGYNLNNKSNNELVPKEKIKIPSNFMFFQIYFFNSDSVFVNNNKQTIFLYNTLGEIKNKYKINYNFTPISIPGYPFKSLDNILVIDNTSKTINISTVKNRKKYFQSISPILLVYLSADSILKTNGIGKFPAKYINSGDNFLDNFPNFCVNENHEIVYSFAASDSIYIYNVSNEKEVKKLAKSRYIKYFNPYPDNKNFDMLFLKKYKLQEPRYIKIIYNPYKKRYYRIANLRTELKKGQKISEMEKFWSVIVMDSSFKILGEHKFNFKKFNHQVFYPIKEGICVFNSSYKTKNNNLFALSVINFE